MIDLLNTLFGAIAVLARITGGYATVTDRNGVRLKTYNSDGQEVAEMDGKIFDLANLAGQTGQMEVGPSQLVKGAEAWALPIGDYVLSASNLERYQRDQDLMKSIQEALPLIAKVAGGEAVLFDREGTRIASIDHRGNINEQYIGTISKDAQRAMQKQCAVIGESISLHGTMAVRIPITKEFGFGFNNEQGVVNQRKLMEEVKKFQFARYSFSDIIGGSEAIQKAISLASYVAKGISSLVISGETGTGKELFAQSIHNSSNRRSKPFVAINCGALPASIIESYLFGYEEGAFTGAKKSGSSGAFEQANGGTILLDELSEMDFNLQSKLLRVLQEKEVTRLGGSKPIKIDVRVIASTNKNLRDMVKNGKFRQDLFYRLNVVEIKIPPLRERKEDIPQLVRFFINKYNSILGKFVLRITEDVQQALEAYDWPGNVRELQNCIEHTMNMVDVNDDTIERKHLPPYLIDSSQEELAKALPTLAEQIHKAEKSAILQALKSSRGSKKEAASLLGISTITLWRKLNEYGEMNRSEPFTSEITSHN